MIKSAQPRSQRKFRYTAPLHIKQHFVKVHMTKDARTKLNVNKRSVQISKGDTVKVIKGSKKGITGKIARVNLKKGFVYLENLKRKNARGRESQIPIRPSNIYIIDLNLSDKKRNEKLVSKIK